MQFMGRSVKTKPELVAARFVSWRTRARPAPRARATHHLRHMLATWYANKWNLEYHPAKTNTECRVARVVKSLTRAGMVRGARATLQTRQLNARTRATAKVSAPVGMALWGRGPDAASTKHSWQISPVPTTRARHVSAAMTMSPAPKQLALCRLQRCAHIRASAGTDSAEVILHTARIMTVSCAQRPKTANPVPQRGPHHRQCLARTPVMAMGVAEA
jgi:hypothetical protein